MSDEKLPAGQEEEYEADLLTLEDEDGEEHTFEVVDAADLNDRRYLAMVPYHENPADALDDDNVLLIMRVGEDEGGEEYLDVLDAESEQYEGESADVAELFITRLSEVYDIDIEELDD